MAHGQNANHHGYSREYWSKRAGILPCGSIGKQMTHELERMEKKKIIRKEMDNLNEDK